MLSSYPFSCLLVVVRVDTHDPSAVVTLLARHVKDCNNKGLQGHARKYTTRLIARVPYGDNNGFCLAALLLSYKLRCTGKSVNRIKQIRKVKSL
jgi:hypothetical protein